MLPGITVLVCTYNRPKELIQTLEALDTHLEYAGSLKYVIADDSSPSGYLNKLKTKAVWKRLEPEFVSTPVNSGWGANVNYGLSKVETDYIFFIEDDYVLKETLNLSLGVALLNARSDLGMLRYRGTAGDHLVYHQLEADVSADLPDYMQGIGVPGKVSHLQIDSNSPSLYIYSHGAHLKRRAFHEFYGLYPVGLPLGQTEEMYAHTVKDRIKQPGALGIAILPEWIAMHFDHIGQSYQHTEHDK